MKAALKPNVKFVKLSNQIRTSGMSSTAARTFPQSGPGSGRDGRSTHRLATSVDVPATKVYKKKTMLQTSVMFNGVASLIPVTDAFAITSQSKYIEANDAPSSEVTTSAETPSSAAITREDAAKTAPCEVQRMPAPMPPTADAAPKATGTKASSGRKQQHAKARTYTVYSAMAITELCSGPKLPTKA